jgi:hypothetical protein
MSIEAERRASALSPEDAAALLDRIPEFEPPFRRSPGRVAPDWLEPLLEG